MILFFYSCSNRTKTVENKDSSQSNTSSQKTCSEKKDYPEITQLPFGPKIKSKKWYYDDIHFYARLISNDPKLIDFDTLVTPTFNLPKIKAIKYIHTKNDKNYICNNGKPVDSLLRLTKYRYRLPDIAQYKSYYMCGFNFNHNDYSETFRNNCPEFAYTCYGYLILYDTLTKIANVIDIYFVTYRDGFNIERRFKIDKNYHIDMVEIGTSGEDEDTSKHIENKYTISISKNGEIKMSEYE